MTETVWKNWQPPDRAPKDGSWMLTHSVGDGLPYDLPESYDFHVWDDASIIRRVDGVLEYEGAFRKLNHSACDSHWDKVVEWLPWPNDIHAEYEKFLGLMYGVEMSHD